MLITAASWRFAHSPKLRRTPPRDGLRGMLEPAFALEVPVVASVSSREPAVGRGDRSRVSALLGALRLAPGVPRGDATEATEHGDPHQHDHESHLLPLLSRAGLPRTADGRG